MNFLDKMGKNLSETVKSVTEKNHKMAKINRLRNKISLAQDEKEKAYIEIGKYYYATAKENPDENIAGAVAKIDVAAREIEAAAHEIEKLRLSENAPEAKKEETNEKEEAKAEEEETIAKAEVFENASSDDEECDTENDKNIPW